MSLYRSFQFPVHWCPSTFFLHSLSLDTLHCCNKYMWYMGAKMYHGLYLHHLPTMCELGLLRCTNREHCLYAKGNVWFVYATQTVSSDITESSPLSALAIHNHFLYNTEWKKGKGKYWGQNWKLIGLHVDHSHTIQSP